MQFTDQEKRDPSLTGLLLSSDKNVERQHQSPSLHRPILPSHDLFMGEETLWLLPFSFQPEATSCTMLYAQNYQSRAQQ